MNAFNASLFVLILGTLCAASGMDKRDNSIVNSTHQQHLIGQYPLTQQGQQLHQHPFSNQMDNMSYPAFQNNGGVPYATVVQQTEEQQHNSVQLNNVSQAMFQPDEGPRNAIFLPPPIQENEEFSWQERRKKCDYERAKVEQECMENYRQFLWQLVCSQALNNSFTQPIIQEPNLYFSPQGYPLQWPNPHGQSVVQQIQYFSQQTYPYNNSHNSNDLKNNWNKK